MKKFTFVFFLLSLVVISQNIYSTKSCSFSTCSQSQTFFHTRSLSSYSSNELFMLKSMKTAHKYPEITIQKTTVAKDLQKNLPIFNAPFIPGFEKPTVVQQEHKIDLNNSIIIAPENKKWESIFSVMPEYMQNFNISCNGCNNLGSLPFWSGSNVMTYGNNDGLSNLDAYQFGLGDVIGQGTIELNPKVTHVGADLLFHTVHDASKRGFYITVRAPLGAMMIDTKVKEKIALHDEAADTITNNIWLTYPSAGNRFQSLTEALQGGSVGSDGIIINSSFHKPFSLEKNKLASCKRTAIRLADLSTALGCNIIVREKGFVTIGAKFSFPTGNVPNARYILEPIFGRASYWGIGIETTGYYHLWKHKRKDDLLNFWFKGELLHLSPGRRPNMRTFDLALNGPGSKYLLLQKYFLGITSTSNPTGAVPSFVTQAANITTLPVLSKFDIEGSFACLFDYHKKNLNFAVGGEFWIRSKESLEIDQCNLIHTNSVNVNDFAVLGRQVSDDARSYLLDPAQPILDLHLCEPLAKINKSINRVIGVNTPPAALTYPTVPEGVKDARLSTNRIPAALNDALDIAGAQAARAMSAKIFGQFGYTWKDKVHTPTLSIIGGTEFALGNNNSTLNIWSIGAQASCNF